MWSLYNRIYDRQVSAIPLAIFRISFAFVLLLEVIQMIYFKELLFSELPYVESISPIILRLLCIWTVVLLLIMLGINTRTAAIVNYVLSVAFLGYIDQDIETPTFSRSKFQVSRFTVLALRCLVVSSCPIPSIRSSRNLEPGQAP